MQYILKNKDIEVLEFNAFFDNDINTINNIKVFNPKLLPITLASPTEDELEKWLKARRIPRDRKNAMLLLSLIGPDCLNNLMAYINISYGLSLNDSFWILPEHKKHYKWADYNLYHNDFNQTFQLTAFGYQHTNTDCSPSPEFTTNGMLKKCWFRKNKKIYLFE